MNRHKVFLVILSVVALIFMFIPFAGAGGYEVLSNGDFEVGEGAYAADWMNYTHGSTVTYSVYVDSVNPRSGNQHMRIKIDEADALSGVHFVQNSYDVREGEQYEATAHIDIQSIYEGKVMFYIEYRTPDEVLHYNERILTNVTGGYSKLTLEGVVPVGATFLRVFVISEAVADGGNLVVDIDDISFKYKTKTDSNMNVTVSGGGMYFTASDVFLGEVTLDNMESKIATGTSNIIIADNRGTAEGWELSVSSSDLVSSWYVDPTSDEHSEYRVSIPASAVKLNVLGVTHINGQEIDKDKGPFTDTGIILTNTPQMFVWAHPGGGMGAYEVVLNYQMTLPSLVPVVEKSGSTEGLQVGDMVGLMTGTYQGTVNFSSLTGL